MTACDVVELLSAATLWIVITAYYEEIWRLPKVGPTLLAAALLASAAVLTGQACCGDTPPDLGPRLLQAGAQICAVATAWLAYRHAPLEKANGRP